MRGIYDPGELTIAAIYRDGRTGGDADAAELSQYAREHGLAFLPLGDPGEAMSDGTWFNPPRLRILPLGIDGPVVFRHGGPDPDLIDRVSTRVDSGI